MLYILKKGDPQIIQPTFKPSIVAPGPLSFIRHKKMFNIQSLQFLMFTRYNYLSYYYFTFTYKTKKKTEKLKRN